MTETPASLDAILASIRARVMSPDDGDTEELELPVAAPSTVPLSDVQMTPSATSITLEELIRSLLAPQIQAWLDANMPEIVEKLAREEIRRLTGKL